MESTLKLFELMQNVVLNPTISTAVGLFFFSFLNELVAIFPYAVVLAGQLIFLQEPLSAELIVKLIFLVSIPVGIGSALGALPLYVLAYFGGKPAIERFHKYLRFSWQDVEKVNARFKGEWYDELLFLLIRCIPLLPSLPVNIAAGVIRMRFGSYFLLTTIGCTIRMIVTLLVVAMGVGSLSQITTI